MESITFYSYKGGVGRTLAVANAAIYLALLGQKVVVIDFDLEAPGLHYKLFPGYKYDQFTRFKGLVDYITVSLGHGNSASKDIRDYVIKVATSDRTAGEIWLMPAGAAPSALYWQKISTLDWHDLLYREGAQGVMFFLEMKEAIREAYNPDVLLIDSRTGITEISGVATTLLADKVICMLLNNRENLEGARVVLRALRNSLRPPGASPVQIFPVISRLPEGNFEADRDSVERVREFLREPLGDSSSPVHIDDILILHNDPSLVSTESILVGGELTTEKSPLLRDYLRLFGKAVSPDIILRNFNPIIQRALAHLLESPDDAQRELENLAFSFNLAPAFRELLRVYRLRNVGSDATLRVAQALWNFGDEEDIDLLFSVVKQNFKEIQLWDKKPYGLYFIEDIWRKSGTYDTRVAIDLAESYDNLSQTKHGVDILKEAWENGDQHDVLLASYIRQLSRLQRWDEARNLVLSMRNRCLESDQALIAWARLEADGPWDELPDDILRPATLKRIEEQDPVLALRLQSKAMSPEEWRSRAVNVLENMLQNPDQYALYRMGQLLRGNGLWEIFVKLVRNHFEPSEARQIEEAVIEQAPYRMPDELRHRRRR